MSGRATRAFYTLPYNNLTHQFLQTRFGREAEHLLTQLMGLGVFSRASRWRVCKPVFTSDSMKSPCRYRGHIFEIHDNSQSNLFK